MKLRIPLVLLGLAGGMAVLPSTQTEAQSLQEKIRHGQAQLQSIHSTVHALQAHIAEKQKTQAGIRAEIVLLDRKIQGTITRLHTIAARQAVTQRQIARLQQEIRTLKAKLRNQKSILADQLRAAYMLGGTTPLAVWLQTEKPGEIGRLGVYYQALAKARIRLIQRTESTAAEIGQNRNRLSQQERRLAMLAEQTSTQKNSLEAQRVRHAQLEQQLADRIAHDQARIADLESNAGILDGLVQRLSREYRKQQIVAARAAAARKAARRRRQERLAAERKAAALAAQQKKRAEELQLQQQLRRGPRPHKKTAGQPQARLPVVPAPPVRLPVSGHGPYPPPLSAPVSHLFGTPRVRGGPDWQGITFAAAAGTPVHAIAPGMVLYSGPLRGYGNIVILQQAQLVLAIYGHLGGTQVHVGQRVGTGTVLGMVGSGGLLAGDGLYLEIRSHGHPVNPMDYIH